MTDTEKLKLLRQFIKDAILCRKPHEAQGMTARDEYRLIVAADEVLKKTRPSRQKKTQ